LNEEKISYHFYSRPKIVRTQPRFYRTLSAWLIALVIFRPWILSAQYIPLASGQSKFLGCATSGYISSYLSKYFNQVTPGNDGKWGSVENIRGQYSWTNLDNIYNYAMGTTRNLLYKHHCLLWGQQQPGWISSLDSASQREEIEEWIQAVGARYPKMTQVDVVNEPMMAPPDGQAGRANYKNALGGDGITGWDWVITAFELARQYCDSSVQLLLNEYNILHDNSRTDTYLDLINLLKERDLIDGIGIQGHYFEFRSDISVTSGTYIYDVNTIKYNLNRLVATGLPVYITEFDIDEPIDADQLAQYKIYFPIFWGNPGVKGITLWGYIESDVWYSHPNTFLLWDNGEERPAMEWLRTYILSPQPPVLISPMAPQTASLDPVLLWHSTETADSFHIQLAKASSFNPAALLIDTVIVDTVLQVDSLQAETIYYWRVAASNEHGASLFSTIAAFRTKAVNAMIGQSEELPQDYRLLQNYPNPFNATTVIVFSLPDENFVNLQVFDLLGHQVRTLVNQKMSAGERTIIFNTAGLNSGIYFYKIRAGNFEQMKKMILIK